jgi:hypothetical protein
VSILADALSKDAPCAFGGRIFGRASLVFRSECFTSTQASGQEVARRLASVLVDRTSRVVVVGHPCGRVLDRAAAQALLVVNELAAAGLSRSRLTSRVGEDDVETPIPLGIETSRDPLVRPRPGARAPDLSHLRRLQIDPSRHEGHAELPSMWHHAPPMTAPTLGAVLPEIYAPLLPEVFERAAVVETRATCDDCAMCDASGAASVSSFLPDAKCCTYHPSLPNYLVGALLADASDDLEEGRRRVRERIASRIGVTPCWLAPSRRDRILFMASRESSFGRSHELLCPYFSRGEGRCTIWRHREAVCATFFCKHDAGAAGKAFWQALKAWLVHVERVLSAWATSGVAPDAREPDVAPGTMTLDDLEGRPPSEAEYAALWGPWVGREETFYVACAERVRGLPKDAAATLLDEGDGRAHREELEARYEAVVSPRLAARLVLNPARRVLPMADAVGVTTYSRYDSLVLAKQLYEALGRLTPDEPALDALRRELGEDVTEELVVALQLHEVIVPPTT